jgi:hypothetical protein
MGTSLPTSPRSAQRRSRSHAPGWKARRPFHAWSAISKLRLLGGSLGEVVFVGAPLLNELTVGSGCAERYGAVPERVSAVVSLRQLISPCDGSKDLWSSSDCSPAVDTYAAHMTPESAAQCLASSTVTSLRTVAPAHCHDRFPPLPPCAGVRATAPTLPSASDGLRLPACASSHQWVTLAILVCAFVIATATEHARSPARPGRSR